MAQKILFTFRLFFFILAGIALLSCSSGSSKPSTGSNTEKIAIAPLLSTLGKGLTLQMSATAFQDDGSKLDITKLSQWTTSNADISSIDNGAFTTLSAGTLTVTASYKQFSASAEITISETTLDSLNINPANLSIAKNTTIELNVIGIFSDGSTLDVSKQVLWSIGNDTTLNQIENSFFQGIETGNSLLTASLNNVSSSTSIEIKAGTLSSIQIEFNNEPIYVGDKIPLRAIGTYAEGYTQDISAQVSWALSDTSASSKLSIDSVTQIASALQSGEISITAKLNSIENTETLTITSPAPTLQSLSIVAINTPISVGERQQFQVIGNYSDGSQRDLTRSATWSSDNLNVIDISNNIDYEGNSLALQAGSATTTASINGLTASIVTTVTPAKLVTIEVYAQYQSISFGTSLALAATGVYSDNSNRDLTELVTWLSQDANLIHVSNQAGEQGVASAINEGSTAIQVSYLGITSEITLNVSPAILTAISISPQNISMANTTQLYLTATGIYSDNRSQDITQLVLWSSDKPNIVSVSNAAEEKGSIRTLNVGEANISASIGELSSGVTVTVDSGVIEGLSILYDGGNTLAKGTQITLSAIGNYSNGGVQSITQQATWQSADSGVCTVSTNEQAAGILSGVNIGLCTINASFNGVSNTVLFTITDATLQSLEISPTEINLAKGNQQRLVVTGQYSDTSTQDLTNQVTWQSSAAISIDSIGLFKALSVANTTIQASFLGLSDEINVTISAASLQSITITPSSLAINKGTNRQLLATGEYSDDSTQNITQTVLWMTTDEQIVNISNATNQAGLVSALAAGEVEISANLSSLSAIVNATVALNPTAPKSLSLSAAPYVIFNDGIDASVVSLNLLALDSTKLVANSTRINLEIVSGSATLDNTSVTSNEGKALFSLVSTNKGIITIKATIENTEISNVVSIYSTDNFGEVIASGVLLSAKVIDDVVQADSSFGLAVVNYTNRPFTLQEFRLGTLDETIYATTAAEDLNNNTLGPGEFVFRGWITEQERENTFRAAYLFNEPKTGSVFSIGVIYSLPSNN